MHPELRVSPRPARALRVAITTQRDLLGQCAKASYTSRMPTYEFRCRECGDTFTESRPMVASGDPATCPAGHADTTRLLDVAGTTTRAGSSVKTAAAPAGGGCCGGGCCGGA